MRQGIGGIVAVLVVLILLASTSLYTVDQRQNAIVFQLGELKEVIKEPGLHFKIPLVQNIRYFDTRILTLDTPDAERYITDGNIPILVDSFVKWRISDVRQFYLRTGGDERVAQNRLGSAVNAGLRDEFGVRKLHEVVSEERDDIMNMVVEKANVVAGEIGMLIVDVRLKRVELPQEVSERVFQRMESERKRVANERRSTGAGEADRIRAEADRQRSVLLAEAYREAQQIKGEGDAKASAIYAKAYGANAEFYSFYRSMEAYRATFRARSDLMVIDPSSEFFRYFKAPSPVRGPK
ncbi:MAG: protease modulator HflC [Burkholderiales bacterium]